MDEWERLLLYKGYSSSYSYICVIGVKLNAFPAYIIVPRMSTDLDANTLSSRPFFRYETNSFMAVLSEVFA